MGVGHAKLHAMRIDANGGGDGLSHGIHFTAIKDAMVERSHRHRSRLAAKGFKPEHGGQERLVHSLGPVVHGGAPHAVVDADRRGDVAAGDAGAAAGLRSGDAGGHVSSPNKGALGFRAAQQAASTAMMAAKGTQLSSSCRWRKPANRR